MTMKISKNSGQSGLKQIVEEMADVDLGKCYQCKKCTSGCPISRLTTSVPSEIIRRLHLGAENELLESDLIWMCLSCETCYVRCPMEINFAAVIDALRALAVARGASIPQGNMPLFNRMFLKTVETYGRAYDLQMIMGYKLGSGSIMEDVEKFPTMIRKGKMAILPPAGADKHKAKRIIKKTQQDKGIKK